MTKATIKRQKFTTALDPSIIEAIKILAAKQNVKPNVVLENFAKDGLAAIAS